MKKNYILSLSVIFNYLTIGTVPQSNLMMGTIQFPQTVNKIPMPRIYYGGQIVLRETQQEAKAVTFSIPKSKYTNSFFVLITESIGCQTKQDNIVDYLKISPYKKHKLYGIKLVQNNMQEVDTSQEKKLQYVWDVIETSVDNTGRIPDNTIIICLPADYIDTIVGGSELELPTIYVKPNVIDIVGSEEKFNEASIALLLASLDSDTLHTPIEQEIKHVDKHTLIAQKS